MNAITKILLPFALLVACDTEDVEDAESTELAASNHGGEGRRGRAGPMRLDTDKDGAISLAEAAGHRLADKFTALDADKDGKLSRDELRAMKGRHGGKHHGDPAERAKHFVQKFDADKEGSLSAAELADHPRLAAEFAALDTDKDGKLALAEVQAMKHHGGKHHGGKRHGGDPAERAKHFVQKFDADKDGSLGAAELADHPRLAAKFAALDTDRDGKLALAEVQAMKHHGGKHHGDPAERAAHFMARADADASGSLSSAEVAGHPWLAGQFTTIDSDGDGALSMAELSAFKPAPRGDRGFGPRGERDRGEAKRG